MKHSSIHLQATTAAIALCMSVACTHDEIADEQPAQFLRMVTSSVTTLQAPVAQRALTRANTDETFVPGTEGTNTPEGVPEFLPYGNLYPLPINKDFTTVGIFLAEDARNSYSTTSGYFRYEKDNKWTSTVGIKDATHNYIFGYMPSNTGTTQATITKRDGSATWADGAKMTLHNLPAATPADVCVVVGVLKADVPEPKDDDWYPAPINDPTIVSQLHQGVYGYEGTASDNYVYLLLEHIYANINVELSVDPEYAKLRNIVLKDVFVRTVLPSQVNCIMEFCNDPKKPIKNIKFDNASGAESTTRSRLFTSDDHMLLTPSPQSIPIYFSPYLPDSGFDYEFHYDVYDREGEDFSDPEHPKYGNLVRKDCIALNHWSIKGYPVEAGLSFKANVKVRPTYLFMLSEPDFDNPTFELAPSSQP